MNNKIFITEKELRTYGSTDTLSNKANSLLLHQKENWDLVKNNFTNLDQIKIRNFDFDGYKIKVQFNPARIVSSSAKVDKKSIEKRVCFLCKENLPTVQKGIKYKDDFIILVNPFPVFQQHLTIPNLLHIPQNIENSFSTMLDLTYDLRDNFFVFYNGPKCGASAPDHLHFQAGQKNSVPLEKQHNFLADSFGKQILNDKYSKVISVNSPLSRFLLFQSEQKSELLKLFSEVFVKLKELNKTDEEPLMNIISTFEDSSWKVFLFPRQKHRPRQFFAEDESKILFSPAAVDMAGLCVFPREEDFSRISKNDLEDMFEQVISKKL